MKYKLFLLLTISLSSFCNIAAQDLPKVFLIGENEDKYEAMIGKYSDLLLSVSDNSMDKAYVYWTDMLVNMEDYADSIDYDIKGVKVWINVFWNKNGKIDHIVYYPKPNSRNIDFDEFSRFMDDFVAKFQMELKGNNGFCHYGSASFPTFGKRKTDRG